MSDDNRIDSSALQLLDGCIASHRAGQLEEWELQLVRRRLLQQPRISAVPLIQRLRKQRDELADVLRWLNNKGGLGLDVHRRIDKALEGIPTYEQQLRNIAEGIGMTYEELVAAVSGKVDRKANEPL